MYFKYYGVIIWFKNIKKGLLDVCQLFYVLERIKFIFYFSNILKIKKEY